MHVDAQPTRPKQRRPSGRKAVPGAPATMAAPNVVVSDAASGAPSAASGGPDAAFFQRVIHRIEQRLRTAKHDHIRWHTVLNNHASTRPKKLGGPLCESVKKCKEFDRVVGDGQHRCRLKLPNSYAADDGQEIEATAVAIDQGTADEEACLAVFARLCADVGGLSQVRFMDAHYNVSCEDLVGDIVGIINGAGPGYGPSANIQPLAEHRGAASGAKFAGRLQDVPQADKVRAADVIRMCLMTHGGGFFPDKISNKKFQELAGKQAEKAHTQLGRLLPVKCLKQFIQQHPEFDSEDRGRNLYIKWKSETSEADARSAHQSSVAAASGASSASASAAHPSEAIQLVESKRFVEAVNVVEANHHEACLRWERDSLAARQSFYDEMLHFTSTHRLAEIAKRHPAIQATAGGDAQGENWSWSGSLHTSDWQPSAAAASGAPSVVEGDTSEPDLYYGEEEEVEQEFLRHFAQNDEHEHAPNETLNAWGFPDGDDREHCTSFWREGPGRLMRLPADLLHPNPWAGLQ
jgi:hypothetical protein